MLNDALAAASTVASKKTSAETKSAKVSGKPVLAKRYSKKAVKQLEGSIQEAHGLVGKGKGWANPVMVVECHKEARPGYKTVKAHEYTESPGVLELKVKELARLIRSSKLLCAYTGAGISTSSGISDYATKSSKTLRERKHLRSPMMAQPTLAHRVLTAMYMKGFLKHWVQQNHDGLPQKAGYPQHALNEIHGAWYNPSNPVVPMSGSLRDDLFDWMEEWEEKTDLTLAIGTSLSGMSADMMVEGPSQRALKGVGLGAVIISIQQTPYDSISTLRIFANIDDVMKMLAKELELQEVLKKGTDKYVPVYAKGTQTKADVFTIPYNKEGINDGKSTTVIDLSYGAKVKLTCGMHKGDKGTVVSKNKEGHYKIRFMHPLKRLRRKTQARAKEKDPKVKAKTLFPMMRTMGTWMVVSACEGHLGRFPLVNCE